MKHPRRPARFAAIAAGIAVVLLASGCAATGTDASPSSAPPSSTATATPTQAAAPTDAPVAIDLKDPTTWLIDFGSVGPLTVGTPIADQMALMTAFTDSTQSACPWVGMFDKEGSPSVWILDGATTGSLAQIVLVGDGKAGGAATVADGSPQTSEGIRVGSTVEQVAKAYPDVVPTPGRYESDTHFQVTDGKGNWITMVVREDVVASIVVRASPDINSEYCG